MSLNRCIPFCCNICHFAADYALKPPYFNTCADSKGGGKFSKGGGSPPSPPPLYESLNMDACPRYLCTCIYVIVCMSARKKAPVNLLMCPFELYMFIGVSMQLRVVFKYDFLVLIPYCWSVALEKKKIK